MFALGNLMYRGKVALWLSAGVVTAMLGCATAPTAPEIEITTLSDLQVENDADATVVTLAGLTEPTFNAFQQEDPARIVVDLDGVVPGDLASEIAVFDGTVDEVAVTAFENGSGSPATRIELSLATVASFEVTPLGDRLEIRIQNEDGVDTIEAGTMEAATLDDEAWPASFDEPTGAEEAAIDESADSTSASAEPLEIAADEMDATVETIDSAAALENASPATTLLAVRASSEGEGVHLALEADGVIRSEEHFVLEDPMRLVVDLPGLVSQVESPQITVGTDNVSQIRIGQHADKVRIVVDGAGEGFQTASLVPSVGGMNVGIGMADTWAPVEDVAEVTEPVAEDTVAMETPEGETTETAAWENEEQATEASADETESSESWQPMVYGVQFDAQAERDRVVILTSDTAEYATAMPDDETVIVRILGATIDPEAAVRIAPEQPGPVSLVTAFDQPEAGQAEVRVVIRRASGLQPVIAQQGTMLMIDFERGEELAGELPMLAEVASSAPGSAGSPPAAIDPDAPLDLLQEGGLVDGKVYTGRRVSLDFKDVDIDDVLRLVAEVSDLNIIAGDEVAGQVTIRLVDVPWDQALDVILLTKGLGFVRVGNVLRIAPSELLKAEEEARLQERRAKEKLEDLVVKLQPVNYANVNEVKEMTKRLLSARGSVDVDERTNTVILKDISSVIDEATALIKAIDTQTPQVMIEAKIVEANLDFLREVGSRWAFGVQPRTNGFDSSSSLRTNQTNPDALGGNDFAFRPVQNPILSGLTAANNVAVANPITELATGVVNIGAFILDERFDVDLQLEAAESHGEGKVISSPRIVTLDNRKAAIEQGVSIPFQTFENGDAKLEFIDAVLRLEVTPHITADRSIIMKLEVQRNAPDDSVPTPTGSPAIAKNEAETETLVKDGQTLVIGGIYVVRQANRESRVPYFHKIPLVGNAFKSNEVRDIRQELLVFVTPRIVVNPELGS